MILIIYGLLNTCSILITLIHILFTDSVQVCHSSKFKKMKNNYDYNQFYAQANRKKVKSFVNIVLYFGKNVTTDTKEKPLQ